MSYQTTINQGIIKEFVVTEFAPDVSADELDPELDLLANGVIDSLGLLKLIAWLEATFDISVDDAALDPDNFRSVAAIETFIAEAQSAPADAG